MRPSPADARALWRIVCMGKGDRKTRRGKIARGSYGKARPKQVGKKGPAKKQQRKHKK